MNMKWDELSKADQCLWIGVAHGWWEWVDMNRKQPIPFPKVVDVHDYSPYKKMSHVMVEAGVFKSTSEATKAGWNKPIQLGEFWLFKRTVRVLVIDIEKNS